MDLLSVIAVLYIHGFYYNIRINDTDQYIFL